MKKHYLFFSNHLSLKPDTAHEIHDVLCANAAANLGYSSVLTYPDQALGKFNPIAWATPFKLQKPDQRFTEFYDTQDYLKIAPLPMPWLSDRSSSKFTNSSTIVCKYYLPVHISPKTKLVHTRNWNFAKAAVKHEIPVIFESHYYQEAPFEKEIVSSPWFQVAITQSVLTRENLVRCGMPPEKAVALHNGFERSFLMRQPQEAETWRQELLKDGRNQLVVYSGALYKFKGVDLLIEVAKKLPEVQFVVTGGTESQVDAYRELSRQKGIANITFLGWILPRRRLVSLFQAAEVLAHPHCSGKEADFTNPVKFFQYVASGTPIVATTIAPLLEFKLPHLAIDWCEPDDSMQFSDCLKFALKRYPRKIEGYAENIEFGKQFSWENRIQKILCYVDEKMQPMPINLTA